MANYLIALPSELLLEIILKASEDSVFTLLNIQGTCKVLREALNYEVAYRSCCMEDLPNLVASPFEVTKFVDLLFTHRNFNFNFLMGIRTMFVRWNYFEGLKLVEEAMEARNLKATYLFCMMELLNGPYLEFSYVDQVLELLGPLKDTADMMWLRRITIQQFNREWNDGSEIEVEGWHEFHGNCDLTKVVGLLPKWTVDYYDNKLYIYCKAIQEMAYFVYMLISFIC